MLSYQITSPDIFLASRKSNAHSQVFTFLTTIGNLTQPVFLQHWPDAFKPFSQSSFLAIIAGLNLFLITY